ncbi:MAG: ATP phosphoribosyltransferase regulatory subunit [Promethearchaeota archaeon]|jgi:histidyl-tRNA synthetase
MSKKFSKQPLRGMKDFYPSDLREYNWVVETIRDIAEKYGYEEYKTPQLEPIEIFAAKSSDELVNEQSFVVEKKKGRKININPRINSFLSSYGGKKKSRTKETY